MGEFHQPVASRLFWLRQLVRIDSCPSSSQKGNSVNRRLSDYCKCAIALLLVGLLGACGSPSQADAVRGALIVVGSGTQQGAINAWRNAWVHDHRGVSVNFSPDGQETGIRALLAGNTYVATTDAPLDTFDAHASTGACGPGGAFSIPTSITPVGVAFNLGGIRGLRIDAPTLSAIFDGSIKKWDDTRIGLLNPTAKLPAKAIIPVTSKSESALSMTSSTYLSRGSTDSWSTKPAMIWPADVAGTKVEKDSDIPKEVDDNFGTIAFMNIGDIGNRFNTFSLDFNGNFASPTTDPIKRAIDESETTSSSNGVVVNMDSNSGTGYQLATVSYQVFCSTYKNESIATMVRSWSESIVSEPGQTKARIYSGIYSPSDIALEAARPFASSISWKR